MWPCELIEIHREKKEKEKTVNDHVDIIFLIRKFKSWLISGNALGKCIFPTSKKTLDYFCEYFSTGYSSVCSTPFYSRVSIRSAFFRADNIAKQARPAADAPSSFNKFSFRKTYGHRAVISMRATNEKWLPYDTQTHACTLVLSYLARWMHSRHFSLTPLVLDWHDKPQCTVFTETFPVLRPLLIPLIVSTGPMTRIKKYYKIYCLIANIYFWYLDIPVCEFLSYFFFVSRTFFVDSPCAFGISYAQNMSIDIIERFCQRTPGRRRDKYVSKHDDRVIYYSVGGKGSPSPAYFDRR